MRYKVNLNIEVGERHIDSLSFHTDCVEIYERPPVCEGIVVEVPEGCDGKIGIEIITIHGQRITDEITVCGVCPDCQDCVANVCVERCPDQLCDNDVCVDCINDEDCPSNQICRQGVCECPTSSEWDGTNCIYINNCPPCHEHNPLTNECTKIICEGGLKCVNNECVECASNADCGNNEKCENGDCVCKSGYIRSEFTGNCIPL